MNMQYLHHEIEVNNSRGVGQFHVFVDGLYHSTWNSLDCARVIAGKNEGVVYNSSCKQV